MEFAEAMVAHGDNFMTLPADVERLTRLFLAQRGLCFLCNEPMLYAMASQMKKNPRRYNREHVVPQSKGGGAGKNIVLSHAGCNRKRANTLPTIEMIARAEQIWALAVRFTNYQVEQFTGDRTAIGTYCSAYKWPAAGSEQMYDPTTVQIK